MIDPKTGCREGIRQASSARTRTSGLRSRIPLDIDGKDLLEEFLHPEKGGGTFPTREEMREELAHSRTSAQDTSVLMKADKVYFFTDTISHSTYYRYVNVCREHKVPFGYIHGVNTDTNVRQVYREMGKEV